MSNEHNEDILINIEENSSLKVIERSLSKTGVSLCYQNANGDTAFHVAVKNGRLDIVESLINKNNGKVPDVRNKNGQTPIDIATKKLNDNRNGNWKSILELLGGSSSSTQSLQLGSTPPPPKKPKLNTDPKNQIKRPNPLLLASSVESKKQKLVPMLQDPEVSHHTGGLKHSEHGDAFQIKLLMLCVHRAKKRELFPFKVATEMQAADMIDDVVFQHVNAKDPNKKTWRFMQAKHLLYPENDKIRGRYLLTETKSEDRFFLAKYFISFCKIKDNEIFTGDLEDFAIVTNTDFHENAMEFFEELTGLETDEILGFDNLKAKKYRLKLESNKSKIEKIFKTKLLKTALKAKDVANSIQKKLKSSLETKNIEYLDQSEEQILDEEKRKLRQLKESILSMSSLDSIRDETKKQLSSKLPESFTIPKNSDLIKVKIDLEKRLENFISDISIIQVALNNDKFNQSFNEFLTKFHFITNYMNELELEERIKEEISEEFKLKQADLLYAKFEKEMFDFLKYYNNGKAVFYTSDDVISFFKYLEGSMCMWMASGLTRGHENELQSYKIEFLENLIPEKLGKFLVTGGQGKIFHFSTQTVLLSAIKVLQTIKTFEQFKEIDSYIFTSLKNLLQGDEIVENEETPEFILNAFEITDCCNLLVIECQENESLNNKLCTKISAILDEKPSKKVVIIAADEFRINFTVDDKEKNETSFTDLKSESKKSILERGVILQNPGYHVPLNQLIEEDSADKTFDQFILSRLLDKTMISIGDEKAFSSIGYNENYYIEREFSLQTIKSEILKEKFKLLFITGASKEDLTKLGVEEKQILEYTIGQIYTQGIIIPPLNHSSPNDDEIFENLEKNSNWLHLCNCCSRFIWKRCKGNVELMNKHIDRNAKHSYDAENKLSEGYFIKAESLLQKIMIVANDSGMGKSTVLTSLARKMIGLNSKNDGRWIVRINLIKYTKKLEHIDDETFNTEEAIDFVTKVAIPGYSTEDPISQLQKKLFKLGLEVAQTRNEKKIKKPKIIIMFDGFNEISLDYKKITTALIKKLAASEVTQIWITSQVHEKKYLELEFESPAFILCPFSLEDQKKYQSNWWKWHLKFKVNIFDKTVTPKSYNDMLEYLKKMKYLKYLDPGSLSISKDFPENRDRLVEIIDKFDYSKYIENLNEQWKQSIESSGLEFTANPLHIKMLTEVIFHNHFEFPNEFGLCNLYNQFKEKKFQIYYEEKRRQDLSNQYTKNPIERDRRSMCKVHMALAKKLLVPDEVENQQSKFDILNEYNSSEIEAVGFLSQSQFIHPSFAEYFLSFYLIDNLENEQELMFSEILVKKHFQLTRQFLNDQLLRMYADANTLDVVLKEQAKELIKENLHQYEECDDENDEENDEFLLCRIAADNHIGIIRFLFDVIPIEDDLYEDLLLKLFEINSLELVLYDITKETLKQLLKASSKLKPDMIKKDILHFCKYDNLLSFSISNGNFCSNFNHIEVILKFIRKNEDGLGDKFLERFVFNSGIKKALNTEFFLAEDFDTYEQILNSFRDNLSEKLFFKFQAFIIDKDLIDLFRFDEELIKWLIEWFEGTDLLNDLLVKYILKAFKIYSFRNKAKEFAEKICETIDDSDICKDLVIIFAYSNYSHEEYIEKLLNIVENDGKIDSLLISIRDKLGKVKRDHNVLSEKISDGDMNEIRNYLQQFKIFHVSAKYNEIRIIDKFLERIKDFSMIREEILLKVDGSGESMLQVAVRVGNEAFIHNLLKFFKEHLGQAFLIKSLGKFIVAIHPENQSKSTEIHRLKKCIIPWIHKNLDGNFKELMEKEEAFNIEEILDRCQDPPDISMSLVLQTDDKKEEKRSLEEKNRLDDAIRVGATDVVKDVLLQNTDHLEEILLSHNRDKKNALHFAAEHNQFEMVQMLFNSLRENPRVVERMALGIDKRNETAHETALCLAARLGHKQTVEKILDLVKTDREVLEKLLLNINADKTFVCQISFGKTHQNILQWIIKNLGKFDLIKLILEASSIERKHDFKENIISILSGTNETPVNSSNWTSLFDVIEKYINLSLGPDISNYLERFCQYIIDLNIFEDLVIFSVYRDDCCDPKTRIDELLSLNGIKNDMRQKLEEIKSNVHKIFETKSNLDKAINEGNVEDVQTILYKSRISLSGQLVLKAILLARNEQGKTALHLAAESDQCKIIEMLLESVREYPRFLKKILLTADRFQEDTALHRAAQLGHLQTVQSLLRFLKNLKHERMSIEVVQGQNGNKTTALKVAYEEKHHQIVIEIFEFMDHHSHVLFIDEMEEIDQVQTISDWTKENEYSGLKQRYLKRIGSREAMEFELIEATKEDSDKCLPSAILTFLKNNEENPTLKDVLLNVLLNEYGTETLTCFLVKSNFYGPLEWIANNFRDDTKFLTKFVLNVKYSLCLNFILWVTDEAKVNIPGIFEKLLSSNYHTMRRPLITAISENDFDGAKKLLELTKEKCSLATFEKLVSATDDEGNILEFIDTSTEPMNSEKTNFLKFLIQILENHGNILEKLLISSNIAKEFAEQRTEYPENDEKHILFYLLQSNLNSNSMAMMSSSD